MSKDIEPTSMRRASRGRVVVAACVLAATVSLAPLAAHAAPAVAGARPTVGTACRSVCAQAEQTVRAFAGACLGCLGQGLAGTGACAAVGTSAGTVPVTGAAPGACLAGDPGTCTVDAGCAGYVDADADGVCDNAGTGAGFGAGAGTGAGTQTQGACRPDGRTWRQAGVGDVTRGGFRGASASPVRGTAR
ncbi:MAG: hypothetical protein SOI26_04255 [Coriobacteriales bacterium]|jgi:hypothetical protein